MTYALNQIIEEEVCEASLADCLGLRPAPFFFGYYADRPPTWGYDMPCDQVGAVTPDYRCVPDVAPVPLPAAGWLLIAALLAMWIWKRTSPRPEPRA